MRKANANPACDLGAAQCLLPVPVLAYRPDTARLALALSAAAYALDIAPWLDAGWQDIAIQVDERLFTGLNAGGGLTERFAQELAASRARAAASRVNPVSQYLGLRRQREEPDTCKALVMVRPLPAGRYLLCVAFMGTGKRLYDWSGNLRLEQSEEGFHGGFLALTRQFEENEARIPLPRTARQLGLEKFTLADAFASLGNPYSRFSLFVTGHSQGAALTQLFIHRLLSGGARQDRLLGYGFASPCVAAYDERRTAGRYPILNIINADDVIARIGAQTHLGQCRVMPVLRDFRVLCQQTAPEDGQAALDTLSLSRFVRGTQDAVAFGMALMRALYSLPDAQAEEALAFLAPAFLPDRLTQTLTGYARKLAMAGYRRLAAKYARLTAQDGTCTRDTQGGVCESDAQGEQDASEGREAFFLSRLYALLCRYGASKLLRVLLRTVWNAHALYGGEERAYQAIVYAYSSALRVCAWRGDAHPAWDLRLGGARRGRVQRPGYDRFHSLSCARQRAKARARGR